MGITAGQGRVTGWCNRNGPVCYRFSFLLALCPPFPSDPLQDVPPWSSVPQIRHSVPALVIVPVQDFLAWRPAAEERQRDQDVHALGGAGAVPADGHRPVAFPVGALRQHLPPGEPPVTQAPVHRPDLTGVAGLVPRAAGDVAPL